MQTSPELVVMAAGIGSRYGGLKQFDGVGPAGETVMDYAVFDAARAGVERVVFVIRRDMEREFHERCGRRYARRLDVAYAFQELDALPPGFTPPPGRTKPWGTGHAVLSAAEAVRAPFIVCNADDFYGAEGYRLLAECLRAPAAAPPERYAMVAFELRRTLSEHGTVSRGVCATTCDGLLSGVREYTRIESTPAGARHVGPDGSEHVFAGDEPVSLNLWGFRPSLFDELRARFERFLRERSGDAAAEFFLPAVIDELIREGRATVSVLRTSARWFGMTHREDRERVRARLQELHERGEYPPRLWE